MNSLLVEVVACGTNDDDDYCHAWEEINGRIIALCGKDISNESFCVTHPACLACPPCEAIALLRGMAK